MTSGLEKRKKAQTLSCFFFIYTPRARVVARKQIFWPKSLLPNGNTVMKGLFRCGFATLHGLKHRKC